MKLTAVPYLGGKASGGSNATGPWIVGLLPYDVQYCEPFAGMLGVLLARNPSELEYANDLDARIVDWWRAARDHHDELSAKLDATPHSFTEYYRCYKLAQGDMSHLPLVERARVVTVCLTQTTNQSFVGSAWSVAISTKHWAGYRNHQIRDSLVKRLPKLQSRLKGVTLFNHNAVVVIDMCCRSDTMVLYLDPPYKVGEKYYDKKLSCHERHQMVELITGNECKARVAVSGYEGEFPELEKAGWRKETLTTEYNGVSGKADIDRGRIEVLWMNYDPPGQQSLRLAG